jgi:signal transduction histidine kinase
MVEELPSLSRDDIQKIALSLQKTSSKLFNLLENLLHWSNSQQGLIIYSPMPLYLSKIVQESMDTLSGIAVNKDIQILNSIPQDYLVNADQNLLQTILRNLISNALKFSNKKGKIEIKAQPTKNKKLIVSIKDYGIGMKKELLEDLFKLDVQTSREGTEGESSTGLGLILCKEFVEKQGGELWVESQENKGSTFYFTLDYFSSALDS